MFKQHEKDYSNMTLKYRSLRYQIFMLQNQFWNQNIDTFDTSVIWGDEYH